MKYYYMMKTLAQTGMRISELRFLTEESLVDGQFTVDNKGKTREIYLTDVLAQDLNRYCSMEGINGGAIFLNRQRQPIGRSAVNKMMQRLAILAGVPEERVHPHSFRHLFAVTYMEQYANLPELADLLGHSNLETTRIYTVAPAEDKRRRLGRLPL